MKALVLEASWEPKPGYVVSDFEKQTGKAVVGNSLYKAPKLRPGHPDAEGRPQGRPAQDQGLRRLRLRHPLLRDRQGRLHPLSRPDQVPRRHRPRVLRRRAEVGKEVEDLQVGDMVTAEEMIWCGHCTPCRDGSPTSACNLEEIGFTIHGRLRRVHRRRQQVLLEAECPGGALRRREHGSTSWAPPWSRPAWPTTASSCAAAASSRAPTRWSTAPGRIGLAAIGLFKAAGAAKVIAFETVREAARSSGQGDGRRLRLSTPSP